MSVVLVAAYCTLLCGQHDPGQTQDVLRGCAGWASRPDPWPVCSVAERQLTGALASQQHKGQAGAAVNLLAAAAATAARVDLMDNQEEHACQVEWLLHQ